MGYLRTALIVMEDRVAGQDLRQILISLGFAAVCCESGHDALLAARDGQNDIIFADADLADMSGLEFARKARIRHPDSFIVGMDNGDRTADFLRVGANRFFRRPVNIDRLAKLLGGILLEHHAQALVSQ